MPERGHGIYLVYVLNIKIFKLRFKSMAIVQENSNVFPEKLPTFSLIKKVKFAIELVLGTSPILVAPYRMAPSKLKGMKAHL